MKNSYIYLQLPLLFSESVSFRTVSLPLLYLSIAVQLRELISVRNYGLDRYSVFVVEKHQRRCKLAESSVLEQWNHVFSSGKLVAFMVGMKTKFLAVALLLAGSMAASARVFVGVGFGYPGYYVPAPPPVVTYAAPAAPYPGPGYSWVSGYWYPVGPRYVWHAGYWGRPPYVGARWVAPRYYGHNYYRGYWRR